MTTGKLKELFDFYGKFLRRQYPDALSKQIDDSMSARRGTSIDLPVVQGHLVFMTAEARRFVEQGRTEKAMRWLGFLQGVLWEQGLFTLDELKEHSRPREDEDGTSLSPSLLAWAFAYPDDPVASKVIASLPPDTVTKLRVTFEQERSNHEKAASLLKAQLEASGVKFAAVKL